MNLFRSLNKRFDERAEHHADLIGQLAAINKSQAVIEFKLDGTIIDANDNFLAAVGYSRAEVQGQHHRMFVTPEEAVSPQYQQFWEKLGRGEYDAGQYRRRCKGGRDIWIQASYNPIYGADGKPFKVVKYATDVTADKLRNADFVGQLAAIGKSQAVIEFELDGTIINANENFLSTVGYSLDEVQGQHHRMFVPPEDARTAEYREFWEKLGRGKYDSGQYRRLGKGGKEIWIQASYNPIMGPDGKPFKVVKYATDISRDKLKTADYEGQLAAISKVQAVIEFELDGTIRTANDNFLKTLGYNLSEIRGQHHRMFVDPVDADSPVYRNFWTKLGRGEFDSGQYKRLAKDGREVWIQASYNPIFDMNGKPFKVVKYATDITEQVNTNAAMRSAVEQTQSVVKAAQTGDLSGRISMEGKSGLIKSLCGGVNAMLDGLQSNRERELAVAAENLRIRNALDNVSSNVMIADNDRCIQYCNNSLGDMLGRAEADIRKDLPGFNAGRVLGESIDQFHQNPAHQKGMLETLRSTHKAQIKVGGRTFLLVVNPIIDSEGQRVGTVVEWQDRTAEVAVESEIGSIVEAAGRGEFANRIGLDDKEGFFKRLATGVNELLESCEVGFTDVIRVLAALSKGDLTQQIEAEYEGLFGELKDNLNATVSGLSEVVTAIKQATDEIGNASRDIAAGSSDLSSRTEQQAASLEETASSMEELTSTVKQNAENAKQANQLSIGASDVATRGGASVGQVVERMAEITDSSKKIEDIISVIEGIAFQTNILALNAAVEAARAGEQGRGFAVVASEVRSLAQRSSGAAKEIKTLIGNSVARIEDGSKLVNEAGKTMEEIVGAVKRVTDIMAEISAASQEQSSGIEQVNQTVTQMDEVTQQNAALVEESSASARSLEDQAATLAAAVSRFRLAAAQEAVSVAPKLVKAAAAARRQTAQAAKPAETASPAKRPRVATPRPNGVRPPAAAVNGGDHWAEF